MTKNKNCFCLIGNKNIELTQEYRENFICIKIKQKYFQGRNI